MLRCEILKTDVHFAYIFCTRLVNNVLRKSPIKLFSRIFYNFRITDRKYQLIFCVIFSVHLTTNKNGKIPTEMLNTLSDEKHSQLENLKLAHDNEINPN